MTAGASAASESPANTRASSQPSSARRAMPATAATSPISTAAAMRPRTPAVSAHSRRSKYTAQLAAGAARGEGLGVLHVDGRAGRVGQHLVEGVPEHVL